VVLALAGAILSLLSLGTSTLLNPPRRATGAAVTLAAAGRHHGGTGPGKGRAGPTHTPTGAGPEPARTAPARAGRAGAGGTTTGGTTGATTRGSGHGATGEATAAPVAPATAAAARGHTTTDLWGPGYRLAAADGGVFSYGNSRYLGSMGATSLSAPVVAIAATPDGLGYWEAAADGGVFAFGDATYLGGLAGRRLSAPVVGMASTTDGRGYWLVSADGGVFAFGDATYLGGMGGQRLSAPVVGVAADPGGPGYWLVSADGGVFTYGVAGYHGGMAGQGLVRRMVGLAATPDGRGYWLVSADGGVFTYGDAHYYGGMGAQRLAEPMVAMAATPTGHGYWLVSADGGVFTYGDAGFWGAPGGLSLNQPVTAVAAGIQPAYRAPPAVELGGRYGFDVSWPQCQDRGLPSGHAFAVLGVSGGQAFTQNPCLGSQWAWATAAAGSAGLYLNLNQPPAHSPQADNGAAGHCTPSDLACQVYNYGGNAADAALSYAKQAGARSPMWWLDVETENAWSSSQALNTLVVKGALDQLHRHHLQAGIYSTGLQWTEITGGASFGVPVWVAGSPDLLSAPAYCSRGFNSGPVWMVQTMLDYDVNYLCQQDYAMVAFGAHPLPAAPVYPMLGRP
jgi:hypothetical protein